MDDKDLIKIGSIGRQVRYDYPDGLPRPISRELVIFGETKAYWKARTNEVEAIDERWFRKKDLVKEPRGVFPSAFLPSN